MPRFKVNNPDNSGIPDGTYVAKVINVREKTSDNGNSMITMKLQLPDGRNLPCALTFVEAAEPVINAFCRSAELTLPSTGDAHLTAADCEGRYLYVVIANDVSDPQSGPQPHVVRFITREQALIKNPALASIKLQPQPVRVLKPAS